MLLDFMEYGRPYGISEEDEEIMEKIVGWGTVAVVVLIIFLIWMFVNDYRNNKLLGIKDQKKCEHQVVTATVMNKADKRFGSRNKFDSIVFQFENGERREFFTNNKPFYNQLCVGDMGLLTFAGNAIIDFERF